MDNCCKIKQFTTPVLTFELPCAASLLRNAERVILTLRGLRHQFDIEAERLLIQGQFVTVQLTQAETAYLNGDAKAEITITMPDGFTTKTNTVRVRISDSVRKELA